VLGPGQSPAALPKSLDPKPNPQPPQRGMSGTLILGSSPFAAAEPGRAERPPTAQQTAVIAPSSAGTLRSSGSIRPAADIASEQGPVALASGQPLAYMSEFPRGAPAPPPEATIAAPFGGPYGGVPVSEERASAAGVPAKRSLLLPLLFFAALGLVALIALAAWVLRGRGSAEEQLALSASAQAPASASAPNAQAAAPSSTPPVASSPTPASAEAEAGPADGTIQLACEPACEHIECDGQPLEIAEGAARLAPGSHECRFERAGYASKTETLAIQSGSNPRLTVRLFAARAATPGVTRDPALGTPTKKPCGTFINPCK
jgi:hypothetical protein